MFRQLTLTVVLSVCATLLQACGCATYSDRVGIGHKAPPRFNKNDLKTTRNDPLPGYAKALGFLTTPLKRMGIFGWRDLRTDVVVDGEVVDSAYSTDHFVTVDIRITKLLADGQPVSLHSERYLRAEVCERRLSLPKERWPCPGDYIRIAGKLMWDGDGFLEVHPQRAEQIKIFYRSATCTF